MDYIDLNNLGDAIFNLYLYAIFYTLISTIPVFISNWLVKYSLIIKKNRDVLIRRVFLLVYWVGALVGFYLWILPMKLMSMIMLIAEEPDTIEPALRDNFNMLNVVVLLLFPLFYLAGAFIFKIFKRYKHFTVFYSNNKIFGLI
jgi:hypothetical protein